VTDSDSVVSAKSSADIFTYGAPTPTVTSITPSSGSPSGGTVVTITGTNFSSGDTVKFGSTAASTVTVLSATSITAKSPSGTGTVAVRVHNANGTSALVTADKFTYATSPTVVGLGTATNWTGGTHAKKSVAYPSGTVSGDIVILVVVGNQEPGPATAITPSATWHGGDLGAGHANHGNVWWRVAGSETHVTVTPSNHDGSSVAWVIAYNPVSGVTTTVATTTTCSGPGGGKYSCGYSSGATVTLTPTMVKTKATTTHNIEISIAVVSHANTLSLSTTKTFTLEKTTKDTTTGDTIGVADKTVPKTTTPTAPTWKQTGTAADWVWVTLAFK
jgi:hypothetical protein